MIVEGGAADQEGGRPLPRGPATHQLSPAGIDTVSLFTPDERTE